MSELSVFEYEDVLVVDSCLIAQRLGIEHESFMRTVENYQSQTEQTFGQFRFEIGTVTNLVACIVSINYFWRVADAGRSLHTVSCR